MTLPLSAARRKLLRRLDGRERPETGLFLAEGVRVGEELLASGLAIEFAVISPRLEGGERGRQLLREIRNRAIPVAELSEREFAEFSYTASPQGVLLVGREPGSPDAGWTPPARLLVLDALQDPGNLGTLVRAARAFGISEVVLLPGTVDAWAPKCVRAAAGALFATRLRRMTPDRLLAALRDSGHALLVAEAGGTDVAHVAPGPLWALVVGNEGSGVGAILRGSATHRVAIPMQGGGESLNAGVAGAILLYALTSASADGVSG